MAPVHNVFDSLGPGSTVGEKGKKRGQIGKISAGQPFPLPTQTTPLGSLCSLIVSLSPPIRRLVPGYLLIGTT